MPKLVIQGGEKRGMHYRVTDETLTIGRAPSNTVVLSDPLVSRRHAKAQDWDFPSVTTSSRITGE